MKTKKVKETKLANIDEILIFEKARNGQNCNMTIGENKLEGVLFYCKYDSRWYFLHNNIKNDGSQPDHGIPLSKYAYSWILGSSDSSIKDIVLKDKFTRMPKQPTPPPAPKRFKLTKYDAVIFKGRIEVGCQKIPNKVVLALVKKLIN